MVLEDQLRKGGLQLEWQGKKYGNEGSVEEGALNEAAAQAVLAALEEEGFPVDEVQAIPNENLIGEANPPHEYVILQMLADWRGEAEAEDDNQN